MAEEEKKKPTLAGLFGSKKKKSFKKVNLDAEKAQEAAALEEKAKEDEKKAAEAAAAGAGEKKEEEKKTGFAKRMVSDLAKERAKEEALAMKDKPVKSWKAEKKPTETQTGPKKILYQNSMNAPGQVNEFRYPSLGVGLQTSNVVLGKKTEKASAKTNTFAALNDESESDEEGGKTIRGALVVKEKGQDERIALKKVVEKYADDYGDGEEEEDEEKEVIQAKKEAKKKEEELKKKRKEMNRKRREELKGKLNEGEVSAKAEYEAKIKTVDFDASKFSHTFVYNVEAAQEKYDGREKREFIAIPV